MFKSDVVIYLDDVAWSRKGRSHRSFISNGDDEIWMRIPILTEDKKKAINQARIDHSEKWISNFWKSIEAVFSQDTYYDHFEWEIKALMEEAPKFEKLIDWNLFFFEKICSFMEVNIQTQLQSEVTLPSEPYYFESDSKNYLPQPADVLAHEVELHGFEKHQSMLHLLFAFGPEFFNIGDQIQRQS